jgi:UDP-glucose 4-epimerase
MKIFVTGGSGYIGSHLINSLNISGYETEIIDKHIPLYEYQNRIPSIANRIDLSGVDAIEKLVSIFEDAPADSLVIHLAARKSVSESVKLPEMYWSNNVGGTKNVLEAMQKSNLKNLIFSSSAAVYGDDEEFVTEDSTCKPISPYAKTKLEEENLIQEAHFAWGLNALVFRFFNVAGAASPELIEVIGENLIPQALQASKAGSVLEIFGNDYPTPDGTCIRDYIHVLDIVDAHLQSISRMPKFGFQILNLGSANGHSVLQITRKIQEFIPLETRVVKRRAGDAAILVANSSQAKSKIGWVALRGLDEIIKSSIPKLQSHEF